MGAGFGVSGLGFRVEGVERLKNVCSLKLRAFLLKGKYHTERVLLHHLVAMNQIP